MKGKDKMIKKYKLKNGDTRYMFHSYIGVDPVTDKDVYRKNGFPSQRKRSTFNDVYDLW